MILQYFHNPRCSKSREGLQLLESEQADITTVLYLEEKLCAADFEGILVKFLERNVEQSVLPLIRVKEEEFKSLTQKPEVTDTKAWAQILAQTPKLLERPLLVGPQAVVIGRPPQDLLSSPDLE